MPAATLRDDYDNPWKFLVFRYFPAFLGYYFPSLHAGIDWAVPPVFLDKDLAPPYTGTRIGKRVADLLVRVHCNGAPLLIHAEIQAQHDNRFAERVLTYNYRIFDRCYTPVIRVRHPWPYQRMMDAYLLVDWLLRLPPAMERQFLRQIGTMEKESHMAYISSAERIGREDGLKLGRINGQVEMLLRVLERQCGPLPPAVSRRLAAAGAQDLERWTDALLDARTLQDVARAMQ